MIPIFFTITTIIDITVIKMITGGNMRIAVIGHVILAVFWGIFAFFANRKIFFRDSIRPVLLCAAAMTAFFPVIGHFAAVFMVLNVRYIASRIRSGVYNEYEEYIKDKRIDPIIDEDMINVMKVLQEEVGFEAYADILKWGTNKNKMRVIEKLAGNATGDDIESIREAVKDPAPEVRFYASGRLLKLESTMSTKIDKIKERTRIRGTAEDYAELGEAYRQYIEKGLAPASLETYYTDLACDSYRRSLDINPDQSEIVINYARCLIRIKEYEKARKILDNAGNVWIDNENIAFARSELFYSLKDPKEVFKSLAVIRTDNMDDELKKVVNFWTSSE